MFSIKLVVPFAPNPHNTGEKSMCVYRIENIEKFVQKALNGQISYLDQVRVRIQRIEPTVRAEETKTTLTKTLRKVSLAEQDRSRFYPQNPVPVANVDGSSSQRSLRMYYPRRKH